MHDLRAEFQSVGRTHAGAVRAHNEDSLVERDDLGLWAVSDGMGGHTAGDVASALVVEWLGRVRRGNGTPFIETVRGAIADANRELYRRGSSISAATTMGATVTVLGTEGPRFFCLWAGDSRLYRMREGNFIRLTRDHRYIQDLLDSGILRESDAETHPKRSVITRAVGIDADVKLDTTEGDMRPGDVFLLATDGVTGVCKDAELAEILGSAGLEQAADKIVALCLKRGAPDNLSLILVKRLAP
jgi:serine/threonine protein phosphatase PrpC